MKLEELEWRNRRDPASDSVVADVERALNVPFPADFASFIKHYHGAFPEVGRFVYTSPLDGEVQATALNYVYNLELEEAGNIVYTNADPPEDFPEGIIIFGTDGGECYLGLDYRDRSGEQPPPVVLWIGDSLADDPVVRLADTFSAFIAMLHRRPELPE